MRSKTDEKSGSHCTPLSRTFLSSQVLGETWNSWYLFFCMVGYYQMQKCHILHILKIPINTWFWHESNTFTYKENISIKPDWITTWIPPLSHLSWGEKRGTAHWRKTSDISFPASQKVRVSRKHPWLWFNASWFEWFWIRVIH